MGYLFLGIALISGTVKGYFGKRTSGFISQTKDAFLINFIRMLFCIIIGLFFVLFEGKGSVKFSTDMLVISIFSALATSVFLITWILAVRMSAYMLLDVFLMLSVLVPTLLCFFIYGEEIKLNQIIGIALLLLATMIMCSYNVSLKGKMTAVQFILLLLCGISYGLSDFTQKWFVKTCESQSVSAFNLYIYAFSSVFLLISYVMFSTIKKEPQIVENPSDVKTNLLNKKLLLFVFIMSACLFANSFFKTLSAKHLSAAQLYPINQGGSMILSLLMSAVFFKEKINFRCIVGIVIAFSALLIMNVF